MNRPEITVIPCNPSMAGVAEVLPDVVFSTETGVELKMQILTPWRDPERETSIPRRPLIVFVQGSAWTFPNVYYELPQLGQYAQAGYVVATVTHRNCQQGHPYPAFLQDVKTAIRFLRKNADVYGVDPDRVCVFGTSSGGNTALLVGLTEDDPSLITGEHAGYGVGVQLVVECFGPTDLVAMVRQRYTDEQDQPGNLFHDLCGGKVAEHMDVMRAMSPCHRVAAGKAYPPFLIIHGDADPVVPYEQGLAIYDKLLAVGADARMICVGGAPHEGPFWSQRLHGMILGYLNEKL